MSAAKPTGLTTPPVLESAPACPTCHGAGEVFSNPSRDRDPQLDRTDPCPDCAGDGFARLEDEP